MKIEDQTIIITGGAGNIGRYLSEYLSLICKKVVILDIDDSDFDIITQSGIDCFKCDVSNFEQTLSTVNKVYEKYPTTSIIINCAGIIFSAPFINLFSKENIKHSVESWDKVIRTNLYSVFNATVCVVEKMVSSRIKGLIINISSISAKGNSGQTAYSAAKAGVNALTSTWGKELALYGIRSAGISPGFIDTKSTQVALNEKNLEKIKGNIPLRRLGKLDEVGSAVKFIIENDYYNGKILELDGGLSF